MSQVKYNLRKNPRKSLKKREAEENNMFTSDQMEDDSEKTQPVTSSLETTVHTDQNSSEKEDDSVIDDNSTGKNVGDERDNIEDISTPEKDTKMEEQPKGESTDLKMIASMLENMRKDMREDISNIQHKAMSELKSEMKNSINKMEKHMEKIKLELTERIIQENHLIKEEINSLTLSQKIINQKFDNLDHKVDNMDNKVQNQCHDLNIQIKQDREQDHITVTKNLSDISTQIKSVQDQTSYRLNDQDRKIKEQNQYMEKIEQRVHTVEDKFEENQFTQNQHQNHAPTNHIIVSCAGDNYSQNVPKFNGKLTNPQGYLEKIKRSYENYKKYRYGGQEDKNKECLHEVISDSMEKSASQWWQLNKEKVTNWLSFEQIFLEKYWNKEIQNHLKQKIELERFRPGGYLNRTDYFLERILILKAMTPPLSETDIIDILAKHYEEVIQTARRVQNLNTITSFETFLQREDMQEIQKSLQSRNKVKPETRRNHQNVPPDFQDNPFNGRENFRAYQPRSSQQYRDNNRPNEERRFAYRNHENNQYNSEHPPRTSPIDQQHNRQIYSNKKFNNYQTSQNNNWNRDNEGRNQNHYYRKRQYPSPEQLETCNALVRSHEEGSRLVENTETRVFTNSSQYNPSPKTEETSNS